MSIIIDNSMDAMSRADAARIIGACKNEADKKTAQRLVLEGTPAADIIQQIESSSGVSTSPSSSSMPTASVGDYEREFERQADMHDAAQVGGSNDA